MSNTNESPVERVLRDQRTFIVKRLEAARSVRDHYDEIVASAAEELREANRVIGKLESDLERIDVDLSTGRLE